MNKPHKQKKCDHANCSVILPDKFECADDAEACEQHGCSMDVGFSQDCRKLLKPNEKCCPEHKCADADCNNISGHSWYFYPFCEDHGCGVVGCRNRNEGPGVRCNKHNGMRLFSNDYEGW